MAVASLTNLVPAQQARLKRFRAERCVDVHCHCLPGLDDGPATLDDALLLCQALVEDGVTDVIATPHQLGRYNLETTASRIYAAVAQLRAALADANIPLTVHAGADVRLDERLSALIDNDEVLRLGDGGRYLLLELPHDVFIEPDALLLALIKRGIRPILSHPERHPAVQENPAVVARWLEVGAVLQVTAGSLLGDFGPAAEATAWALVRAQQVSLVASDAHNTEGRAPRLTAAIDAIAGRASHSIARRLCIENPLRVLEGKTLVLPPKIVDISHAAHAPHAAHAAPGAKPASARPGPRRRERSSPSAEPGSRLDWGIELLLIGLLAFMPLAFGAVQAWSELIVFAAAGAIGLLFVARTLIRRDVSMVRTWAYLPVVLFALLIILQLLPLPIGLVRSLSPQSAAIRERLLADVPNAAGALNAMTLSFYPLETARMLRLVLAASIVFVVVVNVFRSTEQICRLLIAMAVVGGGVAVLALAQSFTSSTRIYWQVPLETVAVGGTFVNRNNFAQFMNLSAGAAIAVLLIRLRQMGRGPDSNQIGIAQLLARATRSDRAILYGMAGVVVVGALAVLLSGSRGGTIALIAAFAAGILLLAAHRHLRRRGWMLLLIALSASAVLLLVGIDVIYDRLATLRNIEEASGGRLELNRAVLANMVPRFLAVGIGLGTHAVVYPMFTKPSFGGLAEHVENEYVQLVEEMGLLGVALVAVFLAILIARFVRTFRAGKRSVHAGLAGLAFGLVAAGVHSFSDFGQRIPAIAILTAAICGLLVSLSARLSARVSAREVAGAQSQPSQPQPMRPRYRVLASLLGAAVILPVLGWGLVGASRAMAAESHWSKAQTYESRLAKNDWQGTDMRFARLILAAQAAADAEPGNIHYRHWLGVYRWYSISRITDPATGEVAVSPRTLEFTRRIVDELHASRIICPTFGPTYSVAGQLELFILDDPAGKEHIRRGYVLASWDPTTAFIAGQLDVAEQRWEESLDKFRQAIALGHPAGEVLDVYLREARRPDLAVAVAGDDIHLLGRILHTLSTDAADRDAWSELAATVRSRLDAEIIRQASSPGASASILVAAAQLQNRRNDPSAAAAFYRRALAKDYTNVQWHLELARTLAQSGEIKRALQEARVCLRLRPQLPAAEQLIAELSRQETAVSPAPALSPK